MTSSTVDPRVRTARTTGPRVGRLSYSRRRPRDPPSSTSMTPDQIALVRSTWPTVSANTETLTERFYSHLFDIDESAARLFAGVDMTLQRTRLAQALSVVVHNIDDPESLMPAVAGLGRRHAGYGVEDRHFDS